MVAYEISDLIEPLRHMFPGNLHQLLIDYSNDTIYTASDLKIHDYDLSHDIAYLETRKKYSRRDAIITAAIVSLLKYIRFSKQLGIRVERFPLYKLMSSAIKAFGSPPVTIEPGYDDDSAYHSVELEELTEGASSYRFDSLREQTVANVVRMKYPLADYLPARLVNKINELLLIWPE